MKKQEQGLSAWSLTMMALGSVIGGSFFLGSAVAIHAAGPSILLGFVVGGIMVYFILFALSEMTVADPASGSFQTFAAQAFGTGTGFVVGWVYWTGMVLAMSSEATAISILLRGWFPHLSIALLGGGIIVGVTLLNLLGVRRLSRLEGSLAAIKVAAIASFILLGVSLIFGWFSGAIGLGQLQRETWMPNGWRGLAGSMLIVLFAYAGFEVIGLAASETARPVLTIPKAIRQTVISLVLLYIATVLVLLPLISTNSVNESTSPIVAALQAHGFFWAGTVLNFVLITAILSTMLASMFGLGRMLRSLAAARLAPAWLQERADVPKRGILFSGCAMLLSLWVGLLFPRVYLFLLSAGGFAMLFSYAAIMATHIRFRRRHGCPGGKCQLWGFPYTSVLVLAGLIAAMLSMPFVKGQGSGLAAGLIMIGFYAVCYRLVRMTRSRRHDAAAAAVYRNEKMQAEAADDTDSHPQKPS